MLRVLTYHRIAELRPSSLLNPRMISATPAGFAEQMSYLANNYRVLSMQQVLDAVQHQRELPRRAVLITFDDAYRDFGEVAWPILERHKLPVTLFVPTGYPDRPERAFWWDRLYRALAHTSQAELTLESFGCFSLRTTEERLQSLKKLQEIVKSIPHCQAMGLVDQICVELEETQVSANHVLSWNELRQLAGQGVTLGAHTVRHPIMTRLPAEETRQEIRQSQSDLQREIGTALPVFCYPSGDHDDVVTNILKEERFVMAFTTRDGHNDLRCADLLRLRRTNITPRTTLLVFRLRLLRLATYVDTWRHRKKNRPKVVPDLAEED